MTRTTYLLILFVLAKIAGIAGVIAFLIQHRLIAGSLLVLDGVLLAVVVYGAYRMMSGLFAEPCEEVPYLWGNR